MTTTNEIESGWSKYPDHRIDISPYRLSGRAWAGDLLLAESDRCLLLEESKHVDRLYFPKSDVHFDLLEETDHHTTCPFKGRADYWSVIAGDVRHENVLWGYSTPFPEVAAIQGYVCFYHERVRIEVAEVWDDEAGRGSVSYAFPAWGDQADLVHLLDVDPRDPNQFVVPAYRDHVRGVYDMNEQRVDSAARNVVEGGHLLGQAIVAASKTIISQHVVTGHIIFSKAASWNLPIELNLEVLHAGRMFSTVEARFHQEGQLRSAALLLLDRGAPDAFGLRADMPTVAGPKDSEPCDMGVTGRDLRIVDGAYDPDPDHVGPPEISVWVRFRDDPGETYLHQALMAQSTTHWIGAAAMRPIPGVGLEGAHITFSGGPMSVAMSFHNEADVTDWLLYTNVATYADRGLTYGEGRIFTGEGILVGSFAVQGMMRGFVEDPSTLGVRPNRLM
jgi:acyl-CoA thioesterase-2